MADDEQARQVLGKQELHDAIKALGPADWVRVQKAARYFTRYAGEADDLRQEAIARALGGERTCPRDLPVVRFLIGVMESIVSSDAKSALRARVRAESEPPSPPEKGELNPEEELVEREREEKLRRAVLTLFEDDSEMQMTVEGIMEDLNGEELCELSGIDRKTLATRRRAFRRRVDGAYPEGWRYDD